MVLCLIHYTLTNGYPFSVGHIKLASFEEEQRLDRSNAESHVGAAVLAHVARSGRSDAALR